MAIREQISVNWKSAACFSAALVVLIALGWIFVARVQAQVPTEVQGQLHNGTNGAPSSNLAGVPVTLFQITQTGPVTVTAQTGTQGDFLFTNVISDANAYFVRVDYAGIIYYSDVLTPQLAATQPISLTVYETRTLSANFTLDQMHLILDVQPKRFNGLELLQVTNSTDRAFYLPLPIPNNAGDPQFDDIREQTRVKRAEDGTFLYPILPTTSEILFGVVLPFTPPDYELQVPFKTNVAGINLLVSKTGDVTVSGTNLVPGQTFTSQSGQQYLVFGAAGQSAGATFRAAISNLPGIDNTQTLQTMVLVGGGLGGLALLAYPVYRRRMNKNNASAAQERISQLQAIANLDDEYEASEIEEEEYRAAREALKAELLKNSVERHD
ncbi:MAG TPA: hypothetical protein VFD70_19110 [Anaerolineae bacterium]|nr:hypothetical protein [Anaerolineae bacterium]